MTGGQKLTSRFYYVKLKGIDGLTQRNICIIQIFAITQRASYEILWSSEPASL
jgi:hypothetical protein